LDYPIVPSLRLDRRFWRSVPLFGRSEDGQEGLPNALTTWYNAEAFVAMFRATGQREYLLWAAWELADYYDPRYMAIMRMASTGDPKTEHWNYNHAEDAMRAFSKYIWAVEFPEIRAVREFAAAAPPPLPAP
jgi:hypothetical protein